MGKYLFGIDLGTTNSCIAYVDNTGRATVIQNREGSRTTPSVVNFSNPDKVVVGQVAKESAVIEPDATVAFVKALMGESSFAIHYNDKDRSPEEVSSYIIRKIVEDASEQIGEEIHDVVITCPAYFGTEKREATKKAGIIAGLNVMQVISEPIAAALSYSCNEETENKTVLVYDLGGGTFDVTVINIQGVNITYVCSDGNSQLGGKDWDGLLMNYIEQQFRDETGYKEELDEYAVQDLQQKVEQAKIHLTAREEVPVMVDVGGLHHRITLTKATFDEITKGLLNETLTLTDAAIGVAESKGYKIDEIILVGGSTKMPQVRDALIEKYGMTPRAYDQDEAVAKGAAIYALDYYQKQHDDTTQKVNNGEVDINDEQTKEKVDQYKEAPTVDTEMINGIPGGQPINITFTTSKSYALKALVKGEEKCQNLILKNQPMPEGSISVTEQFQTVVDNQREAELVVFENDFDMEIFDVDEEFMLGSTVLELPDGLPKGSAISVTFTLNNEGLLEVTGVEGTTGKAVHAEMHATSGATMSQEAVEEARKDVMSVSVE